MAGKHSAGGHARKKKSGAGKLVVIVVIALVLIAALVWGLAWFFTARPVEEIPGREAMEQLPAEAPEEEQAPVEEPEEEQKLPQEEPVPQGEEAPEEEPAPVEEPADEEIEMESEFPEEPQAEFAEIFESAGIEPVYQLADDEGMDYAVFARGDGESGISQYEFLYEGDMVVTMAETYYEFSPGISQADLETNAQNLEAASQPPEGVDCVTISCEAVEGGTILRILIEGLDDPNTVQQLSELALIPVYTDGGYLSYGRTGDNMGASGYMER